MSAMEIGTAHDNLGVGASLAFGERIGWQFDWLCEKWSDEACDFTRRKLEAEGVTHIPSSMEKVYTGRLHKAASALLGKEIKEVIARPKMIEVKHGITSEMLRKYVGAPEDCAEVAGNLLLNEGIQEMEDLLIAAGGTTAYNNANAEIGVGDSATAAAATDTDLLAASNKLFKAMNATYPQRAAQTLTFVSDFLTGEANYVWNEASIRNGVTRNKNLNRKVQSLGTKVSGTWTITGTLAIS